MRWSSRDTLWFISLWAALVAFVALPWLFGGSIGGSGSVFAALVAALLVAVGVTAVIEHKQRKRRP